MNKKLGEFNIRNLMISYVIIYTIMPIVQRLTSRFLTAYFYMAVVVVLVILLSVSNRSVSSEKNGFLWLPFILYGLLTVFYTHEDILMWGYQTLLFLLPVIIGYYFTNDNLRIKPIFSKFIILCVIVTMITTIIGCIRNPSAARVLATVSSQDSESYLYDMQNIGGYSFVYIVVLLYPILILSYKLKRIKLPTAILLAILVLLTIVYTEYTTALLLFAITSILFFTKSTLSSRGAVIIAIFTLLFLLFFSDFIAEFLRWLGNTVGSEAISMRLNALAGGRSGLEHSEDNRLELYQMSINHFLNHPIFGTLFESYKVNGGHSFVLDNLASFGLFGGVLMFLMYKGVFKRFLLPYKGKTGFGYIVWFFIQAIILSIVNTGMWLEVLCLFAPILLHWIYGNETETKEVNDEAAVDSQLAPGASGGEAIRTTE